MQMNVVVERPVGGQSNGHISCRPVGRQPIRFEWTPPRGVDVQLDESQSEAHDVTPGRYKITAIDATDARADVVVDVDVAQEADIVVTEYRTVDASTSHSRDGQVELVGRGLDGWRFLWTNGVETETPVLRDVPPGTYAAVPLPNATRTPTINHHAVPGVVRPSAIGGRR